jgi:hypothetical protein
VVLVRTDVSEEGNASIIRVERISKLGTETRCDVPSSLIPSNLTKAIRSSETSVLTRVTRRHIQEDSIPYETIIICAIRIKWDYASVYYRNKKETNAV